MKLAWKQILVTFSVSLVIGALIGRWQFQTCMQKKWEHHKDRQEWIIKKLSKKLELSPEQKLKVREVFEETRPQMEALRAEVAPKFDAIRKSVNRKIRPILNVDQQKKFDEIEARWETRRKAFHRM